MDTTIYDQVLKLPYPTREEEVALFQAYQQGAPKAMDAFIYRYMGLAISMSIYMKRKGVDTPLSDLIQEGMLGLVDALKHFNPDKGVRFTTYASYWVKHYLNGQRQLGFVGMPRTIVSARYRVARAENFLYMHLAHAPSVQEIAEWMGVSESYVSDALRTHEAVSTSDLLDPENDLSYEDLLMAHHEDPIEEIIRQEEHEQIGRACATLDPREQRIVKMRYEDDLTLDAIGQELGLSRERVRQILLQIHASLKQYVTSETQI